MKTASIPARRRSVLWRIHFWSALIASPFTLVAALTGMLYIFTPQIESLRHGWLDRVEAGAVVQPLDDAVAAARAAVPSNWQLQAVLPAHGARASTRVVFNRRVPPGHEGHHVAAGPASTLTAYVNPYTARLIGILADEERFGNWSGKLHSRLLQGDGWRWMIELAATAMMVMLLSGLALWWPGAAQQALPQAGAKGRLAWKQWHAFLGVALGVLTLTMLATGLTWSRYAGEQIRAARNAVGQAPPQVPRDLLSTAPAGGSVLSWQVAWMAARNGTPDVALQLNAPRGAQGVWKIAAADPSQPGRRFDLVLDAYTGRRLYYSGWDQQTLFGKATAIGIPFHRGQFGWWNQALLLLFAAGVVFSLVSGWVMYFKRRQGMAPLPPGAWKSAAGMLWLPTLLLFILMPLMAVAAAAVLLLELLAQRRRRPA